MSRFEDALGLRGEAAATAKVACDQPFYALAAMVDSKTSEVSFVNPADAIEKVEARKAAATTAPVDHLHPERQLPSRHQGEPQEDPPHPGAEAR